MGRQPTFKRIHTGDPKLEMLQDALQETLAPVLGNPLFGAADFRWAEVAGANPSIPPTFALQYRTPGTQTWVTAAYFTSTGAAGGDLGGSYPNPTVKRASGLPIFANNAAAIAGGLSAGALYRTGADPDPVCVVH